MKKYMFAIVALLGATGCTQPTAENKRDAQKAAVTDTAALRKAAEDHAPFTGAYAQPEPIDALPKQLAGFVPEGYAALDTASGDLNLDNIPDMILVLKQNGEDTATEKEYDNPILRPLIILTGNGDGSYKQAARNDKAVLCYNCAARFGDPFSGITIKHGYFSIEHVIAGGHHWESVTTFKYDKQKADWFLYKDGFISYKMNDDTSADAEALVKDVETQKTVKDFGIVPFSKYDTYKD